MFRRLLLGIVLLTAGCAGEQARNEALLPTMKMVWPNIRVSAEYQASPAEQNLLDTFRIPEDLMLWPQVRVISLRAINQMVADGQISSLVAESLKERVRLFDEAVEVYNGRP